MFIDQGIPSLSRVSAFGATRRADARRVLSRRGVRRDKAVSEAKSDTHERFPSARRRKNQSGAGPQEENQPGNPGEVFPGNNQAIFQGLRGQSRIRIHAMSMLDPGWIPARLKLFSSNRTVLSHERDFSARKPVRQRQPGLRWRSFRACWNQPDSGGAVSGSRSRSDRGPSWQI